MHAREDLLAFTGFPQQHWRKIWSTDESVKCCAVVGAPAMGAWYWRPGAAVKVERPTGRTTLTAARTAVASAVAGEPAWVFSGSAGRIGPPRHLSVCWVCWAASRRPWAIGVFGLLGEVAFGGADGLQRVAGGLALAAAAGGHGRRGARACAASGRSATAARTRSPRRVVIRCQHSTASLRAVATTAICMPRRARTR